MGIAEVASDMDSVSFGIFNDDNPGITIKPVGFSLTEALLAISILEIMDKNNGKPPSNLPGGLAKANKYNYQKEYAKAKDNGLSGNDAKQEAIKNISFGKHRQNMGYADMEIQHGRDTTVTHDSKGKLLKTPLENVPGGINVKDAKLTDRSKLDKKLDKYKGVHENGRE